jgi:hypothetical protein
MTRYILGLIALLVGIWVVRGRRSPQAEERVRGAAAARALRDGVLSRQMLAGLPTAAPGTIRGAVMDWNLGDGLATLVAIEDGAVSLYLNPGGGIIGAGTHTNVASAAEAFRNAAARQRTAFSERATLPAPGPDSVVFYLLTDSATLSSGSVAVADVQQGTHPLAALATASQALFAEVRRAK